ncbi:MAG: hypothetical protein QOK00_866 [Thermoleophilaceae bacterium]|nr:hypothetical protein [Thermoleophilaceae bacterium]
MLRPTLRNVGVVVDDLNDRMVDYAELLGIATWRCWDVTGKSGRLRGRSLDGSSWRVAEGSTEGGVVFQLIEPLTGDSSFAEFLMQRGQGIHHLTLASLDADSYETLRANLAEKGIVPAQHASVASRDQVLFDTRASVGGWYLAVDVETASGGENGSVADRVVELPPTSAARKSLPVARVAHFGVVVRDVFAALDGFAALFGEGQWEVYNWGSAQGMLTDTQYHGRPVEHAYVGAMARIGDVEFEVVQPTFGPTHYREDFLDTVGEGIHHLYLAEYDEGLVSREGLRDWAREHGLPVVMSGMLCNGAADFEYVDTAHQLGGFVVEGSGMVGDASPSVFVPNFMVDYGEGPT